MYFDPAAKLVLPQGVRLASRARVAAALLLGLLLFGATLGIGYIAWSLFAWRQGRTPAQRILNLRCWLPEPRRVADRDDMAVRQVLGFFLCGGLLWGFFVWLVSNRQRSAGDLLAGTVVLHDPDGVLVSSSAPRQGRIRPPRPSRHLRTQEHEGSPFGQQLCKPGPDGQLQRKIARPPCTMRASPFRRTFPDHSRMSRVRVANWMQRSGHLPCKVTTVIFSARARWICKCKCK
jgi:uncharacterized RDD family membrane protein YckC